MSDIAKNIKKLRQRKNMTQEELAEKLFVTRQAVSNWETGKNQPDVDTLKSLAETLEVDIKDVIYGPGPDQKRQKILVAGILCLLAAIAWGTFALVYDKSMLLRQRYEIGLSIFLVLVLRPMTFLLTGGAIPALISIWRDLHPTSVWVRRWMMAVALAVLLVYALGCVVLFRVPKVSYYWTVWTLENPWIFLILGALLFCGLGRKAG